MGIRKRDKIIVEKYNPEWAIGFEQIKTVLLKNISSELISIEHIGSTSIVGLAAKPVIDIDIVIENDDWIKDKVIEELSVLGYKHRGNLGITGREAFENIIPNDTEAGSILNSIIHHLYLCKNDSIGFLNHINFRNYLRGNPSKIEAYSQLKRELAQKHPYNIDAYIDGKTDFIIEILNESGMNKSYTNLIDTENRKKDDSSDDAT